MKLSEINNKIKKIQRINVQYEITEKQAKPDPFEQFLEWFDDVLNSGSYDPSAMVLATIDKKGLPDARVVLLKELKYNQFIFYSNYKSKKADDLSGNNVAALNFYWPHFVRQVRIRGRVVKADRNTSEAYFATRPREAQLSSFASQQSSILSAREELINNVKIISEKFLNQSIPCPENWGGYVLDPFEYEFFQGRIWRMHDRLLYTLSEKEWKIVRLAP